MALPNLFPLLSLPAQWTAGTGLVFGSSVDGIGIQLRGSYELETPWRVSVDGIQYFRENKSDLKASYEWNANAQYASI